MTPGSQFPHSNARQSAEIGNLAAQVAQEREVGQREFQNMPDPTEAERDALFQATFGVERSSLSPAKQDAMWNTLEV